MGHLSGGQVAKLLLLGIGGEDVSHLHRYNLLRRVESVRHNLLFLQVNFFLFHLVQIIQIGSPDGKIVFL